MIIKSVRLAALVGAVIACALNAFAQTPEEKLAGMNLTLPAPNRSIANYVSAVRTGNLIFLAGQLGRDADGKVVVGKVGTSVAEAQAVEAARGAALALISTLKSELGDLRRVKRVIRVGGFVNCTDDFTRQSSVINGCSDLLVAVFGDAGRHARVSIGSNSLPLGAVVEVEMIAEVSN
jgi:enamine deaminase RidA (YjgF/YER057c/UK114 family)